MSMLFKISTGVRTPWLLVILFFFSSRRRHTRCLSDWSSDVCSSDLEQVVLHLHPVDRAHGAVRRAPELDDAAVRLALDLDAAVPRGDERDARGVRREALPRAVHEAQAHALRFRRGLLRDPGARHAIGAELREEREQLRAVRGLAEPHAPPPAVGVGPD